MAPNQDSDSLYRLPPFCYMHVLDLNKNTARVETGPKTYVRQDNERVILPPTQMVTVAPRYYCIVKNPVSLDAAGKVQLDKFGQVLLSHADSEVRLTRDPFPLYPGEELIVAPTELQVVPANSALRLRSVLDFDDNGKPRVAGDEWLFEGPGTYIPRKEVKVLETVNATIILPNQALRLRARLECNDRSGVRRVAGEEWQVQKIGAYLPGAYEDIVCEVKAHVLTDKKALHVRAVKSYTDQLGVDRKNGEEWLVTMEDRETYIPDVYEEVVKVVNITTLNNRQYSVILNPVGADGRPQLGKRKLVKGDKTFFLQPGETLENGIQDVNVLGEDDGLILRATEAFADSDQGVSRAPGDRWMLRGPAEYVPSIEVVIVSRRKAIPLDENEGIYVRDVKTGRVRAIIGQTYMLTQDEQLWAKQLPDTVEKLLGYGIMRADTLQAAPTFANTMMDFTPPLQTYSTANVPNSNLDSRKRGGSRFDGPIQQQQQPYAAISFGLTNICPPCRAPEQYQIQSQTVRVPPKQQQRKRNRSPEIRDRSAERVTFGVEDEELWEKDLPPTVEGLLSSQRDALADRGAWRREEEGQKEKGAPKRDKTKVVTFRVPHNAAVQIYDYKDKKARVAFGPDLVMLGPDEHFTQLSLSGGKPKRPNVIKSLCLLLGPDFCTDIVTVETADHARLQLQLSYNWYFSAADRSESTAAKLFSVPDFVGDACKMIASRTRGMVAQVQFDDFHKNSARIIRSAVFGLDEAGKVKPHLEFPQNQLVVTSIDIQSVEPVDQRTRDSLQKSVQLAIEITTNSQEAAAKHEAERLEQEAKGKLERQKIVDQAEAEKAKKGLLELQALSAAVESTGQAKAEAQSRAESARIEGEAAVEMAKLKSQAAQIDTDSELTRLERARESEIKYTSEMNGLEVGKVREMSAIEIEKFQQMVGALGATTIQAIATAGPEMQVKLLQGLGLQTALITDGKSPINLFNTASGLVGGLNSQMTGQPSNKKSRGSRRDREDSEEESD